MGTAKAGMVVRVVGALLLLYVLVKALPFVAALILVLV